MKKLLIVLLILCSTPYFCQEKVDTLQSWISKFCTIANLTYSPDGKLATIKKWYANNLDTVVILDTRKPNAPIGTVIKMENQVFLKDNTLLSSGNGKVRHTNFNKSRIVDYDNVRLSDVLLSFNQYFILDENGVLKLFSNTDEQLQTIPNVLKYATDKHSTLFVHNKKGTLNEIIDLSGGKKNVIYSTEKDIKQMKISTSGKVLIVTEDVDGKSNLSLSLIDIKSGKITKPEGIIPQKADYIDVTEIQGGKAYFIAFTSRTKPPKNILVDVWYGNDNQLQTKQMGTTEYSYWLWKPESKTSVKLPNSFPIYHPIDNDRYILAFNPSEEFKNITLHPFLNIRLYDTVLNTYQEILHQIIKDIVHSAEGKYIIAMDSKDKKWIVYDINAKTSAIIDKVGLQNPVFRSNFKTIYFESDRDIWKYEIGSQKLEQTGVSYGKEATIANAERKITNPVFGFKMNMVDVKTPLLIRIRNKETNTTSFSLLDNGKTKIVFPSTPNRIKEVKFDSKLQRFATLEENYNMAPKLYITQSGKQEKEEIFHVKDKTVSGLKQDIVSFSNSRGASLKGVLYYPKNFSPSEKYPMVVYIYQIKSTASNVYPFPSNEPTGVNRRTLLEHGYFVYEPDIVFDSRGTGLSALDCVHSALDAIKSNTAINMTKVGLTGHSMGGYETSFIATHSDRFAAFIPGAALIDMVSTYFSYDYAEQKPNHNRFETGQFEMNKPFSEDKELYFKNSPINYVENVKAPVLVWNGLNDNVVIPQQAMEFYIGLKRNNLPVIALFYVKSGHDLGHNTQESKDMNQKALDWWQYFLKGKTDIPWINRQIKRDAS